MTDVPTTDSGLRIFDDFESVEISLKILVPRVERRDIREYWGNHNRVARELSFIAIVWEIFIILKPVVELTLKLAYIDESGTPGEEGWFLLNAFIIDSNDWRRYDGLWDSIPPDIRAECEYLKDLRHPHDSISPERLHDVSMGVYDTISEIGYRVVSVIVHQPFATNFCEVGEIYDLAFEYLIERFEYLLTEVDALGVVFVDERDDKSPLQLQDLHYTLKREGTDFADFQRTIGAAAPLRDDESIPMSLADWVGSAIRNCYIRDRKDYYAKIHDNMQRHPRSGKISGSGIKVIPKRGLEELYYHPDRSTFDV